MGGAHARARGGLHARGDAARGGGTTAADGEQHAAAAEDTTRVYADMLPPGITWDAPLVAELLGLAQSTLGAEVAY